MVMLLTLTGCSMKSLITPAATVTGAAVGSIGGQLVTAITTGDVKGIVAAQMKNQEGKIQEVTSGIWSTLKIAALVILGVLLLPLIWTRSNAKKINKICEETKNAKTD